MQCQTEQMQMPSDQLTDNIVETRCICKSAVLNVYSSADFYDKSARLKNFPHRGLCVLKRAVHILGVKTWKNMQSQKLQIN